MCRFLLVKFKNKTSPKDVLNSFAKMSEQSRTLDGDWQGDGWGVSWKDDKGEWQTTKSLSPIWMDRAVFSEIPPTSMLVVHARSASFPSQKGVIEFNQPFVEGGMAFVFNGFLRGVNLKNINGTIGAQKIWNLLKEELKTNTPDQSLKNVKKILLDNSKEISALNIGLVVDNNLYYLNYFSNHKEYYELHKWQKDGAEIICSEVF